MSSPLTTRQFLGLFARQVLFALVVVFLISVLFGEARRVSSTSMLPTLRPRERVIVFRAAYPRTLFGMPLPSHGAVERGHVIALSHPSGLLVKRVVALAGDTLWMRDGYVWVNGVRESSDHALFREPVVAVPRDSYQALPGVLDYRNWGPVIVPPEHLFVLGDNRDASLDSRVFGPVPVMWVRGRVVAVYYSPKKEGVVPDLQRSFRRVR